MSTTKKSSTPMRLEDDVREWINVIRDAFDLPNHSDAVRMAIKKAFPNIEEIAEEAKVKEEERQQTLAKLTSESETEDASE